MENYDPTEPLALEGGPKAKRTPFPSRKRHGNAEKRLLEEVIDSDVLFYFLGTKVYAFQRRFIEMTGMKHCIACSSGTAAVHMAVAALQLPPGSEVITSAITDMGTVTGVLYQGLVPVFADVDPATLNMDPEAVRKCITQRTRAILVVHHGGLAADMDALVALADEKGLPLVEDCAQAYGCEYRGRRVGTMGVINAFSLNQFKHITCGSGGMVVTNDDGLRYHASIFLDKCYQREDKLRNPFFLAPNYQMTELQGAVALAQLDRVMDVVDRRRHNGTRLDSLLRDVPGVTPQTTPKGCRHSYFMYLYKIDRAVLRCTTREFSDALAAEGIPSEPNQITGGRPIYMYDIFQNRSAFPGSQYPFVSSDTNTDKRYAAGDCPIAEQAYSEWIVMHVYEHYRDIDIDEIAFGIRKVAAHFARRASS